MTNVFNYQYSIFGNFSGIITNIQEIAKKFESFRREVTNLINPIGQQQPLYAFSSPKIGLRITFDRIDFLFSELNEMDVNQIDNIINESFGLTYFTNVNRIAINYSTFDREDYEHKLNVLKNNFSLIKFDDRCREVSIRYNYESSLDGISLNNIVSIQNIVVQDSRNFESFPAVLFSLDINTVVSPQVNFKITDVVCMFAKLQNMALKEMKELIESVEG